MQIKNELRSKARAIRKNISSKDKFDVEIKNRLLNLAEYKSAKTVLIYVSLDNEIKTDEIILNALDNGKNVAVPFCEDSFGNMNFYLINSLDDLKIGSFNVREPNKNICRKLENFSNSIIIVPGMLFDKRGYRLGYGKGYYDRFLSAYNQTKIGLSYDETLVDELFTDEFDKNVDIIITQSRIISCKNGGKNG